MVLLFALGLYLATLDNGLRLTELQGGDLITHQYAQAQARLSNAPGYPLYTMGGWLWFHLGRAAIRDIFSPIEILSLYSTFWSLAALAALYFLALRLSKGRWYLAVAGCCFYAVTYFFWYYSVSTEQYTSAVFQSLLLLLLALRWRETRKERLLGWLALVLGTCLANLVTVLLVTPALVWFVLSVDPGLLRRPRLLTRLAALAFLPLASYAYVYARGAQHPEWWGQGRWDSTLDWFLSFLSTRQGRGEMTLRLLPLDFGYLALVARELTWPILLAGLLGLAVLPRRLALLTCGTLAAYLAFSYVDRYGNWFQVLMPAYPLLVLGVVGLATWAGQRLGREAVAAGLFSALLLAGAGERLATNLPRSDLRDRPDDEALCPGLALVADAVGAGARGGAVAVTYEEGLSLDYLSAVYGVGSDLSPVPPSQVGEMVEFLSRLAVPALPSEAAGWQRPQLLGAVLLASRWPAATAPIGESVTLDTTDLSLVSSELRELPAPCGGRQLVVRLEWRVREPPEADFVVSLRPVAGESPLRSDERVVQVDHPPLWGLVPTSSWQPGERWLDAYALFLPPGPAPDAIEIIGYLVAPGQAEPLWRARLSLPPPILVDPLDSARTRG